MKKINLRVAEDKKQDKGSLYCLLCLKGTQDQEGESHVNNRELTSSCPQGGKPPYH